MTGANRDDARSRAAREQRLVFGEDAAEYDRVRPSYPGELIDDLVGLVGLPSRAVDAGCGTGKATLLLAARGIEGVGVEPDPAMARVAERRLADYPGWRVDVADFEDWQPADENPFDLVTCAQAWHWIDHERGARQAERLLRRGGWLAILGHDYENPDTPLRREIDAAFAKHAPEPSARSRAPRERVPPGSAFEEPLVRMYRGFYDYTTAHWIALMRTSSDLKMLPADRRELLLEALAAAIDRHGGVYRHRYVCELWAARRL